MIDTFKAYLVSPRTIISSTGKIRLANVKLPLLTFTKDAIIFPKLNAGEKEHLSSVSIYNGTNYTLKRLNRFDESYTKDAKFQAVFKDNGVYNLRVSFGNEILLKIVHKRYGIQKHWEWFWKTIVTVLIGAVIGYFVGKWGYKEGYKDGLMDGKHSQLKTNPSP